MTRGFSPTQDETPAAVAASAPASLSNLGPGFDCLGVAIDAWGDTVQASANESGAVEVFFHETSPWMGPRDPEGNTAGVAARGVLDLLGEERGVRLVIRKGVVPGSGVGSSAASAAAAAFAVNLLFGARLAREQLVPAVLAGEAVASGSQHGDNVLPSLLGGMVIASAEQPSAFRRLVLPESLHIALILPRLEILTRSAREILPKVISLSTATANASHLAMLVAAMAEGDWAEAGRCMMLDRIAEPHRARLLPEFEFIRSAATDAGAYGCALSGSGPAVFAISDSKGVAEAALSAMMDSCRSRGRQADGIVTRVASEGAREAEPFS